MLPERANIPAPALINAPVVAVDAPEIVSLVAAVLTLIVEVVPAVRVKLRLVEALSPVY